MDLPFPDPLDPVEELYPEDQEVSPDECRQPSIDPSNLREAVLQLGEVTTRLQSIVIQLLEQPEMAEVEESSAQEVEHDPASLRNFLASRAQRLHRDLGHKQGVTYEDVYRAYQNAAAAGDERSRRWLVEQSIPDVVTNRIWTSVYRPHPDCLPEDDRMPGWRG